MRATIALLTCCAALSAQPLRDLADQRHVRIGTAVNPALLDQPEYAATLAREFNQAEPENAMKFGPIHPQPETYNFGPADRVVDFAREHKMAVRGHTLVWHNQNAAWVTNGNLAPDDVAAAMEKHIRTVVGRYAGKVYAWDVVNEAFNDDGTPRKSVWAAKPDYIERAFRIAHEADPKALLFYNDYSAEAMNKKSDAIFAMARDFKQRGVPLTGVGMQMHFSTKPPAVDSIEANIRRLTELGLEVQITELDVRVPLADSDFEAQAKVYRDLAAACLKSPKCTAIQLWGFTDKYSWVPRQFPGFGAALPFDASYRPKPAYDALAAALR